MLHPLPEEGPVVSTRLAVCAIERNPLGKAHFSKCFCRALSSMRGKGPRVYPLYLREALRWPRGQHELLHKRKAAACPGRGLGGIP